MKNQTALLTFTTVFLLFIPFGKFISRTFINIAKDEVKYNTNSKKITFDNSLRNFHPNKGE